MPLSRLKVTVALVCYEEKTKLGLTLWDLKEQSAFESIGEILLLQNGSCKETKKTAEAFLNKLPLKIFSNKENNLGQARSRLVQLSQYDLIAWTDSDCRLPKNWLKELIQNWKVQASALAVGGPNRLPENTFWKKAVNLSLSQPLGHGWSPQAWKVKKKTETYHIPTCNGLFSKKAILSVGNFSEKYKTAGEDFHLGLRLKQKGSLWLFPNPLVINDYASSYLDCLKRIFIFGKIRSKYKNFLFYPCLLFTPCFFFFLFFGLFQKVFLLPLLLYFLLLHFAGFFVFLKSRQSVALLLPLFWFGQQIFYSSGTVYAFFLSLLYSSRLDTKKSSKSINLV